jgi:EAL domain-containing protein (putative c-di-GMP-specific phosphodiesterase class I)
MLELTEEAFLAKREFQNRILPMVREVGARISIDDFGVGYSSLSALADITADEVKVDRSFVTDVHRRPRSQSVLKAIEALGHSLGMQIVVEGVETFEELAFLQAATRIHYGQGFYFSKPVLLEELIKPKPAQPNARSLAIGRDNAPTRGTLQLTRFR